MVFLKKSIAVFTVMIISFVGLGQIQFEGKVIVDDLIPVVNAKVTNLKSGEFTYTNTLGKYKLTCNLKDKLLIEAKGFSSKKIKVKSKGSRTHLVLLKKAGSDKIAIQNGHILNTKELNEYLESKSNSKPKDYSRYGNAIQIIKDHHPNVKADEKGLVIRGGSSLMGNNYAAIEIDGVLVDFDALKSIPTASIKKITILTTSQSALYGSNGGNGVVKVTTFK
jgi:hypothetical protein